MTTPPNFTRAAEPPITYEFRLSGHLDDHWSDWFGGHTLVRNDDASTTLTVEVADQAHLHGLLGRVRDLGVTLLSLNRVGAAADASRERVDSREMPAWVGSLPRLRMSACGVSAGLARPVRIGPVDGTDYGTTQGCYQG